MISGKPYRLVNKISLYFVTRVRNNPSVVLKKEEDFSMEDNRRSAGGQFFRTYEKFRRRPLTKVPAIHRSARTYFSLTDTSVEGSRYT